MKGKRILILSEAFGAGHTKAAEAIREGIRQLDTGWEIDVIELGVWLRPRLSQVISGIYLKTLRYSPKLWGILYRKVQNRSVKPRVEFILHRMIYAQVIKLIRDNQPDVIIATHPFPSAVISRLKRMGLNVPLHTVLTDYGAHGSWVSLGVNHYYLPSIQAKEQLTKLGVPKERLHVTGIPTHPKFWEKHDKASIRKKLGLDHRPTLLFMGGGEGIGLSEEMMDTLNQFREEMQILIITGRNQRIYSSLTENKNYRHPNIHIYGFVENIDEFMDASDLLITKPGGVTSAEALTKQIPMIVLHPIPGQEEDNSVFIISNQLGVSVKEIKELKNFLQLFVETPSKLFEQFKPNNYRYTGKTVVEHLMHHIYSDRFTDKNRERKEIPS